MNLLHRLQVTFIAGLLLLLPLAVILIVAMKVIGIVHPFMVELAEAVGITIGVRTLAALLLVGLCLLAGLLMRTTRIGGLRYRLERNVLSLVPGYEYIRERTAELLGQDNEAIDRAILVRFDDGQSPGRLVERDTYGRCAVFIPDVPNGSTGAVLIVDADRVEELGVPYGHLSNCIRNHGKGLLDLVPKNDA